MSEKSRYDVGLENLQRIDGKAGDEVIKSLGGLSEDIGTYILEFAFGDIYHRDTLDFKQREMITIASLLSQGGCEPQLVVHINGALNVGLTQKEIIETCIQCIPYVGFPKVLNAVFAAKKVFEERELGK